MPNYNKFLFLNRNLNGQRGQALFALLVILVIGLSAGIYGLVRPTSSDVGRDKITADALAQAKAALIGYAVGVTDPIGGDRPGDLPCPDLNDGGNPTAQWTSNCNAEANRIGRLPWKHLGLPDLRDGDGERLWYAVSNNFKNNGRTACSTPGVAGCLNSDTRGTISVRNNAGTVIHDGTNPDPFTPSGAIAVIFAPGRALLREDGVQQIRDCSGTGCVVTTGVCNSATTPKCNPVNYLDIRTSVEDNANFTDSSNPANGFINGVIRDASGNVVVNDRLLVITYQDLMPLLERRVAKEALNCLAAYANVNNGRYPWAADLTIDLSYQDTDNTRFGRIPDGIPGNLLSRTVTTAPTMADRWPTTVTACNMIRSTSWNNWKEMVFYGFADAYKPVSGLPSGGPCGPFPSCLRINPPSAVADKRVIVAVAGKRLSVTNYPSGNNQPRTSTANKQDPTNYLEGENNNPPIANIYEQQPISASFNDVLLYQ